MEKLNSAKFFETKTQFSQAFPKKMSIQLCFSREKLNPSTFLQQKSQRLQIKTQFRKKISKEKHKSAKFFQRKTQLRGTFRKKISDQPSFSKKNDSSANGFPKKTFHRENLVEFNYAFSEEKLNSAKIFQRNSQFNKVFPKKKKNNSAKFSERKTLISQVFLMEN